MEMRKVNSLRPKIKTIQVTSIYGASYAIDAPEEKAVELHSKIVAAMQANTTVKIAENTDINAGALFLVSITDKKEEK